MAAKKKINTDCGDFRCSSPHDFTESLDQSVTVGRKSRGGHNRLSGHFFATDQNTSGKSTRRTVSSHGAANFILNKGAFRPTSMKRAAEIIKILKAESRPQGA